MGLPREDTALIRLWSEVMLGGPGPGNRERVRRECVLDMMTYAMGWAARRRDQSRRDDVTSLLLEATFEDGRTR